MTMTEVELLVRQQAEALQRHTAILEAVCQSPDGVMPPVSSVNTLAAPSSVVASLSTPAMTSPPGERAVPMLVGPEAAPGYVQVGVHQDSGQPLWLLEGLVTASLSGHAP